MQSAGDLLRDVQDTDDAIDFSLKKSVQYHVRKELRGICAYLLDDVEVDDTLGSSTSGDLCHPVTTRRL